MILYRVLVALNAVCGALLTSSASFTAMFTNLGGARGAAVTLGIAGIVQLILTAVLHSTSGPPTPTPAQK